MSTLRKLRRQAERQEIADNKRRTQELIESRRNLGVAQMLDGMIQQGISKKDLDDAYSRGYKAGIDAAAAEQAKKAPPLLLAYLGATALALHRECGFGGKRASRVLSALVDIAENDLWIDSGDLLQRCRDEMQLDISTIEWKGWMDE
jgi:hypothetical protein